MIHKTTIKLDIDEKPKKLRVFCNEMIDRFTFFMQIYEYNFWLKSIKVRETVKGYHFYINVLTNRKLKDVEIIYIQLALGSDYKREGFNMIRSAEGNTKIEDWNMLFIDKEKVSEMSSFLEEYFYTKLFMKLETKEEAWYSFLRSCGVKAEELEGLKTEALSP